MNEAESKIHGRVRKSSPEKENREIDQQTLQNIRTYDKLTKTGITRRLKELDKEWDIEKTLEVNASSLVLTGLLLGTFVNKR